MDYIIQPMGENLLVALIKAEEKQSTGGIIIPEAVAAMEKLQKGKILAISPDIKTDRKPGDLILYYPKRATPVTVDDKTIYLITIGEVQAWLEPKSDNLKAVL
jgi:co-chaperonin GroES (HSP10)